MLNTKTQQKLSQLEGANNEPARSCREASLRAAAWALVGLVCSSLLVFWVLYATDVIKHTEYGRIGLGVTLAMCVGLTAVAIVLLGYAKACGIHARSFADGGQPALEPSLHELPSVEGTRKDIRVSYLQTESEAFHGDGEFDETELGDAAPDVFKAEAIRRTSTHRVMLRVQSRSSGQSPPLQVKQSSSLTRGFHRQISSDGMTSLSRFPSDAATFSRTPSLVRTGITVSDALPELPEEMGGTSPELGETAKQEV